MSSHRETSASPPRDLLKGLKHVACKVLNFVGIEAGASPPATVAVTSGFDCEYCGGRAVPHDIDVDRVFREGEVQFSAPGFQCVRCKRDYFEPDQSRQVEDRVEMERARLMRPIG